MKDQNQKIQQINLVLILLYKIQAKMREKSKDLQAFNSRFLIGKGYFSSNASQDYLIFQSDFKYFQMFCGTDRIFAWESREGSIETSPTSDNSFIPKLTFIHNTKI